MVVSYYFTRKEAEQLGLDGDKIGTFSSEYDEFVDEFDAHGVGSVHGRPSWGQFVFCNLCQNLSPPSVPGRTELHERAQAVGIRCWLVLVVQLSVA
jgi:hypothetical protein